MSSAHTQAGHLVIISGPSSRGEINGRAQELIATCPLPLVLSVSATTRPPREGERDGVNYFFISHDDFSRRRAAGEFLECKEVFGRGQWYGTLQSQVASGLAAGKWVILEIDVEGAQTVIEKHPTALTIFIHSGSIEELEARLRKRNSETEASLARRLEVARRELACKDRYRHEVINRDVPQAVRDICEILSRHVKD